MRGHRDGFALLSVLWLVVMVTGLMAFRLVPVATNRMTSENRIADTKATWAALGCVDLFVARHKRDVENMRLDSVALGPDVWCRADVRNVDERVDPNIGDSVGLVRLLDDRVAVASILDWIDPDDSARVDGAEAAWYQARGRFPPRNGPITHVHELALIRGFESVPRELLDSLFAVDGDGTVSVRRAPPWALRSVSALPEGVPSSIVRLQRSGSRLSSVEHLVASQAMRVTAEDIRNLSSRLSFDESRITLRSWGHSELGTRLITRTVVAFLEETDGSLNVRRVLIHR